MLRVGQDPVARLIDSGQVGPSSGIRYTCTELDAGGAVHFPMTSPLSSRMDMSLTGVTNTPLAYRTGRVLSASARDVPVMTQTW